MTGEPYRELEALDNLIEHFRNVRESERQRAARLREELRERERKRREAEEELRKRGLLQTSSEM